LDSLGRKKVKKNTVDLSDRDLLKRIANKDEMAFVEFYDRHYLKVRGIVLPIVKCDGAADECCNTVFIDVWRFAANYKGDAEPTTWLYRIAWNEGAIYLRTRKLRGSHRIFENADSISLHEIQDSEGVDFDARDRLRLVIRKLSLLDSMDREVLIHSANSLENAEGAAILGVTVPAYKSVKHRARLKIRRMCGV
jgi:RNA polymerase sigma-70 factor (ECF subfamily)